MAALRLKREVGNLFQGVRLDFLRSDSLDSAVLREESDATFPPLMARRKSVTYRKPIKKKRSAKE